MPMTKDRDRGLEYAVYRWRDDLWAIPTGPINEDRSPLF